MKVVDIYRDKVSIIKIIIIRDFAILEDRNVIKNEA
jgi:hypothetical protein